MKKNNILVYGLLLLCTIFSINYPTSKSKYIKEDNNSLQYSIKFDQMTGDSLISDSYKHGFLSGSNYETLNYFYTFNRSGNMLDTDISETYEIELSNGCNITDIHSNNASINNNLITFNSPGTELVTVNFKCSVKKILNNDMVSYSMNVKEYFNESDYKYNYTSGYNTINIYDYYLIYPKPADGDTYENNYTRYIMPANRENKFGGLRTWLSLFADNNADVTFDEVFNYIKATFNYDYLDDSNLSVLDSVRGFIATKDSDGNYVFTINDTFTSRVKSYTTSLINKLYLLNTTYDTNALFVDMLNQFNIYNSGTQEYDAIVAYLNEQKENGIDVIELAKTTNIGLKYDEVDKTITVSSKLYYNITHQIPVLKYKKTLSAPFKNLYLTKDLNNTILSGTDLQTKIVDKNNTDIYGLLGITDVTTMFERYIYIEGSTDNILLHLYSNDEEYTYVEIIFITNEINISYFNNSNILEDLKLISSLRYTEELELLDTDSSSITNFSSLESGTYNLNIGTLSIINGDVISVSITLK